MPKTVTCAICGRPDRKVSPGGFIARHKNPVTREWCVPGSGRHQSENKGEKK